MTHDDHLADHIRDSYAPAVTTATVNGRVDQIITDFETFRAQVRHWIRTVAIITGFALGTALAAVVAQAVSR